MNPLQYHRRPFYGYTPTLWDSLIGTDWGTDRCMRNAQEAYLCYSEYMLEKQNKNGWPPPMVQHLISKAQPFSTRPTATAFWKGVQQNFLGWFEEKGYHISDFPKWEKALRTLDAFSDSAFSYDEVRDQFSAKQVGKDLTKDTADDLGSELKKLWKEIPVWVKIAGGSVLGIYVLGQVATIAAFGTKTISLVKKDA